MALILSNTIAAMVYLLLLLPYFFNDRYLSKTTEKFRKILVFGLISSLLNSIIPFKIDELAEFSTFFSLFIGAVALPVAYISYNYAEEDYKREKAEIISLTILLTLFFIHFFLGDTQSAVFSAVIQSIVLIICCFQKESRLPKARHFLSKALPAVIMIITWCGIIATGENYFTAFFSLICLGISVIGMNNDFRFYIPYCLDERALGYDLQQRIDNGNSFTVVAVLFDDLSPTQREIGGKLLKNLTLALASKAYNITGSFLFNTGRGIYSVVLDGPYKENIFVVEALADALAEPVDIENCETIKISPRICVAEHPCFASSAGELISTLCFAIRRNNKMPCSDIVFVCKDDMDKSLRESAILHSIRQAISNNGICVYYQPLYNVKTQKFDAAEALVRIEDDFLKKVSPEEFIPVAEKNGLISELGEAVLKNVCHFIQDNNFDDLGLSHISVNLSTIQCSNKEFIARLISIIESHKIEPQKINFEITESCEPVDEIAIQKNMNTIIKTGAVFSIDDYGTGFSTEKNLISFPAKVVKIDKSILWLAEKENQALTILSHTIKMLKELGKEIVVEGVETKEMVNMLSDMGCDYLQGYYFSKPIPENEYLTFIYDNIMEDTNDEK